MHGRSTLSECQREQLVVLLESGIGSRAAARRLQVSRDAAMPSSQFSTMATRSQTWVRLKHMC